MSRLTTLPAVLYDHEGRPLRPVDEVALVIGMVAGTLQEQEVTLTERRQQRAQRTLVIGALLVVAVAALLLWWLQQQGEAQYLLPIVVLAALLLALLVGSYLMQARTTPAAASTAAVTRLGRAYWPVGVLPLDGSQALLWDAHSPDAPPLQRVSIPADLGASSEQTLNDVEHLHEAFEALLGFEESVSALDGEPLDWPAPPPDESTRAVASEVESLWPLLVPVDVERLPAVLPAPDGLPWADVSRAGRALAAFHQARPADEAALRQVQQRAEGVAERAREVLVERHWRVLSEMEAERREAFGGDEGSDGPATMPGGLLALNTAESAAQLGYSLGDLRAALAPLDSELIERRAALHERDAEAAHAASQRYEAERRALDDEKRRLDLIDSEILEIGARLDGEQARIHDYATSTQRTFGELASLPLADIHQQLAGLEQSVRAATGAIGSVNERLDLDGVAAATDRLKGATAAAHEKWTRFNADIAERSARVQERTERMLGELSLLTRSEGTMGSDVPRRLDGPLREVTRVTSEIRQWASAQQDPIIEIEDKHQELESLVAALRQQRSDLADAQGILARLNDPASEGNGALPAGLTNAAQVLDQFRLLAEQTSSTVRAMDNAAELVRMQSERLERLLRERDLLREQIERRLADLQQREQAEGQARAQQLQEELTALDRLMAPIEQFQEAVQARLTRAQAAPALRQMGRIAPKEPGEWPDRVANDLGLGIEAWGQTVAGLDAPMPRASRIAALGQTLAARHEEVRQRAVPAALPADGGPMIAFVPFWLVESATQEGEGEASRRFHLFPPAQMGARRPTDAPTVDRWLLPTLSSRIAAHLSSKAEQSAAKEAGAVTFEVETMSEAARALDLESASVPPAELATAMAQHWIVFRSEDALLNKILLNSRNQLIPSQQIIEAWERSVAAADQPRLPGAGE